MRIAFLLLLPFVCLFGSCGSCSPGDIHHSVKKDSAVAADSTAAIMKMIGAKEKIVQLDTFFDHRFVEGKFSGCVLVAQHGIVLFKKAFGWADYEKRDSLQLTSSFQLASVSKQFTASAIMLLHQQGKLNYSDTIGKYLQGFPYHDVTIEELLTHRGGLDKYEYFCDDYYRSRDTAPSYYCNDSVICFMKDHKPAPYHPPGKKFDYSNTGFVILASVVEKISGEPFYLFMQQNFFGPLGMTHTWVDTDGKEHPEKTKGYYGRWKWWEENYLDSVCGDKGVYSTVEDLYKWDRALRSGTILHPDILKEAFTGHSPELVGRKYWNYGFGWRTITFDDGAAAVFHNGWWHGYTSTFYRGLTDDVTVIMLCNKYNMGIYNVTPVLAILGAHHEPLPEDEIDPGADSAPPAKPVDAKKSAPVPSLRHTRKNAAAQAHH